MYADLKPAPQERVREELHKLRRLVDAHEDSLETLAEEAKEIKGQRDDAHNRLFLLLRADEKGDPAWELKSGILTTEAPDAQSELPGTGE
jgi:hypothetical protein